jgi:hypothetical protein
MSSALGPTLPASSTEGDARMGREVSTNTNSRKMRCLFYHAEKSPGETDPVVLNLCSKSLVQFRRRK